PDVVISTHTLAPVPEQPAFYGMLLRGGRKIKAPRGTKAAETLHPVALLATGYRLSLSNFNASPL
ncbi:MAG: hypothetical protein WBD98_20540, partial [Acidobacteriaceae bacterium]